MPQTKTDTQVASVEKIVPPESLLDAVLSRIDTDGYDSANPFISRFLLCGRKRNGAYGVELEKLVESAISESNLKNPFYVKGTPATLSTLVIDYGESFLQFVEGAESYYRSFFIKFQNSELVKRDTVRILFVDDDVPSILNSGVVFIDKVPPSCLNTGAPDTEQGEVRDIVLRDVASAIELSVHAATETIQRRRMFAENAKVNYPKLFPKAENLGTYIQCGLFFTLDEFVDNFCSFPDLVRDVEINHPVEDPLKF